MVYELHSSSSFNRTFLKTYKDSTINSDESMIYLSDKLVKKKKYKKPSKSDMCKYFNSKKLIYVNELKKLISLLSRKKYDNYHKLFMSSGNFDGINLKEIYK